MSKSSKFGLGVIFGAIAGAVAALLSAPKSGKETREELKKAADNFGADAEKKLKSLHAEANKLIEKCEAEGKKLTGSAKKDADATLEKANQLKDRVKRYIAEVKNGDENSDDLSLDDLKKELKDIETSATAFLKKAATKTVSEVKKKTSSAPKAKKPATKK
jgi:gas vesicle protein